jgi:hypothetical protein
MKNVWALLAFTVIAMVGCSDDDKSLWECDPKGAETIYESSVTSETEEFKLIEETDADGSRCVSIEHHYFPASELYRLYSPNGNLRIIASGAQEQCGLGGYRIDYDEDGRVCNVIRLCALADDEYLKLGGDESSVNVLKRWLDLSLSVAPMGQDSMIVERDQDGNITSMRDIDIPYGYRARLFIKEWGPFWESDINGGCLGFFVMVENVRNTKGSYVNYLYLDGKLIAELAYRDGVFIKARTYNNMGVMVNVYTDSSVDVVEKAYNDFWKMPTWYVN